MFCEMENVTRHYLGSHKYQNDTSDYMRLISRRRLEIDIGYLRAVYYERIRLWNIAHDYYFWLEEKGFLKSFIAAISERSRTELSWINYFDKSMFARVDDYSLLQTTISDRLVSFLKFVEELPELLKEYKGKK